MSENLIELEDFRPVWTNSKSTCDKCHNSWIATHHKDTKTLECPHCGNMTTEFRKMESEEE